MAKKKAATESFASLFRRILSEQARDGELAGLSEETEEPCAGLRRDEAVAAAVVRKALRGDVAAVKFLCDVVRETDAAKEEAEPPAELREIELTLQVVDAQGEPL